MVFETSRLPNGATVATAAMPFMQSACVGVWALVGSRHEPALLNGISHFVEHMVFKGTRRRKASRILAEIEGIGGSVNAFTELDHTCYYAKAEAGRLARLVDVLFDLYREPAFPAAEVDREREVIEEEILMYRENPSQHVEDLLGEAAWPDAALGRSITGTPDSLARIGRPELRAFVRDRYQGANTLVTVAGRVTHAEVMALVGPLAGRLPRGRRSGARPFRRTPGARRPVVRHDVREIEQVHWNLGFHTPGRSDPGRFALKLLSVILGENMSSRLFQRLREERGLCYNVQTDVTLLAETGLLSIYAGVDPDRLPQALEVTGRELGRLAARPPSRAELRRACEYAVGMLRLSQESTTQQAMWLGESLLAHRRVVDPGEVCARLEAVTPAEVSALAAEIFRPGRASFALVGPVCDAERLVARGLAAR